jgi:hypothetical protein
LPVGEADADEGNEVEHPRHAQQGVEPALVLIKPCLLTSGCQPHSEDKEYLFDYLGQSKIKNIKMVPADTVGTVCNPLLVPYLSM